VEPVVAGPAAAEVVDTVGMPVVEVGRGCETGEPAYVGGLVGVRGRDVRRSAGTMMARAIQRERCCSSLVAILTGRLGGSS